MDLNSTFIEKTSAQLRRVIDWRMALPDYVFRERMILGFFIVESGVLATREFLDFMLNAGVQAGDESLAILVRKKGGGGFGFRREKC